MKKEKVFLTTKEVADLLNKSYVAIRKWIQFGKIPYYKKHGNVYFDRQEIIDWVKSGDAPENIIYGSMTKNKHVDVPGDGGGCVDGCIVYDPAITDDKIIGIDDDSNYGLDNDPDLINNDGISVSKLQEESKKNSDGGDDDVDISKFSDEEFYEYFGIKK